MTVSYKDNATLMPELVCTNAVISVNDIIVYNPLINEKYNDSK